MGVPGALDWLDHSPPRQVLETGTVEAGCFDVAPSTCKKYIYYLVFYAPFWFIFWGHFSVIKSGCHL